MLKATLIVAVMLVAVAPGIIYAVEPEADTAESSVDYITSLQNSDGGFPAFGTDSSAGSTIDAVFALISARVDPTTVINAGYSPADYLQTQSAAYSAEAGALAKLVLCVRLMGMDVTSFGGVNLLSEIDEHFDDGSGTFGDDNFDQALFLLSAEMFEPSPVPTRPAAAAERLRSLQQTDGGWEFVAGQGSDSNTTAIALQGLLGRDWGWDASDMVDSAMSYLRSVQNDDGGFGFLAGADSDPNSTALVIQALLSAEEDIGAGGPWERAGGSPIEALLSYFNPATGAFQYANEDSAYATYQAVPALMLAPFPWLESQVTDDEPTPRATLSPTDDSPSTPTPAVTLPETGSGPGDAGYDVQNIASTAALASLALMLLGEVVVMRLLWWPSLTG